MHVNVTKVGQGHPRSPMV